MINKKLQVSFIGFGNLAKALTDGACNSKILMHSQLMITSPSLIKSPTDDTPYQIAYSNKEAAMNADVIVLAIKPQQIANVCFEIAEVIQTHQLIISVATGKTVGAIERYLNKEGQPIVRAMPNTAVAVNAGSTAIYCNKNVRSEQREFVQTLFESTGIVIEVETEAEIDLITAISGSGPAYFLYLQEALESAAIKRGLSKHTARALIKQTMYGASLLTRDEASGFQERRLEVTSARGTTAAAIAHLDSCHFMQQIDDMVEAAFTRAQALSND